MACRQLLLNLHLPTGFTASKAMAAVCPIVGHCEDHHYQMIWQLATLQLTRLCCLPRSFQQ